MCIATGGDTKKAPAFLCKCLNHKGLSRPFPWSHLGLNQGPPDYESGATNQLSGASHGENQRVMKPCRDWVMTLLTGLLTYSRQQILG